MKRALFLFGEGGESPRRAVSLAVAGIAALFGHGTAGAVDACTAACT